MPIKGCGIPSTAAQDRAFGRRQREGWGAHCTCAGVPAGQTGLDAPCAMTHCEGVQGKASGSAMPALRKSAISRQGSAMRHQRRPCRQALPLSADHIA